LALPRLLD
jgi:hypothetical protein